MFKIVVWGTGGRGKKAAEILGMDRIEAFIDSNPEKFGKKFYGKSIIDFENYKKYYQYYPILVSIVADKAIADILRKEDIFYFSYNECPPELIGYGWKRAKKYIKDFQLDENKVVVYGHTLYSILVYEFLETNGYECVGLVHNSQLSEREQMSFDNFFPFIKIVEMSEVDEETTVLQTVSDYEYGGNLQDCRLRNIYDWKEKIPEYYNPQIASLENKYKGKRCFIVATGPSLTFHDLEQLKINHEFCISVNTIFCCFNETEWRPDQYVVVDVDAIETYDKEIRKMDVKEKFLSDASLYFDYKNLSDEFYVYHSVFTKDTVEKGLISDDFSKYTYNSGTVTAVALQLAMYEGFDEIYLLGCDCSYFQTGVKHFNEPESMQIKEYGVQEASMEMLSYHMNAYKKIKDYARNKGIKIYNATRGGYLEVFERINFDDLF
ncbi:6-hydroxymethylpterin diphosphokinase MptE-like protein [Lachnospiraceae bacterium 47-T17]